MKKKRIQIKPFSDEISFAFAPKTGKKFFMRKDEDMPKLIEILQDNKVEIIKKDDVLKILRDEKISDVGINAIEGALKILLVNKDELPTGILTKIAKSVPEYGTFAEPCGMIDEDAIRKKIKEKLIAEMKKDGKGLDAVRAQVLKLEQDLAASNEQLKAARTEMAKAQDEREFIKIKQDLIDAGAVGDLEETAHTIQAVSKVDADLASKLIKQQKDIASMVQALGIDDNLGRGGGQDMGSPYDKLNKMVQDKMGSVSGLKIQDAWKMVKDENPGLFKEYLKGRKGSLPVSE